MSMRNLEGVIKLPHSVLVDESVLGQQFCFNLKGGEVELWFPALSPGAAESDWHVLGSPLPDAPRLSGITDGWGCAGFGKHPDHPRPLASWVNNVAFRASVPADASRKPWDYACDFGEQFDAWLGAAEQWIDLWAPHALCRDHTVVASRGQFWDSSVDPEQLTGWSSGSSVIFVRSASALNSSTLKSAIRHAAAGDELPTEWLFLLRARQAVDPRTAVIEAATAAEVALAQGLHQRLAELSDEARERIIVDANGLVGLLRLVEDIDSAPESSWKRVAHRLGNPRNRAVHAGAAPSDVMSALQESTSILQRYAPLPRPDPPSGTA